MKIDGSPKYDDNDPLLTTGHAAKRLGVTPQTIRRWLDKGAIDYFEVGPNRRRRILRSEVDKHRVYYAS